MTVLGTMASAAMARVAVAFLLFCASAKASEQLAGTWVAITPGNGLVTPFAETLVIERSGAFETTISKTPSEMEMCAELGVPENACRADAKTGRGQLAVAGNAVTITRHEALARAAISPVEIAAARAYFFGPPVTTWRWSLAGDELTLSNGVVNRRFARAHERVIPRYWATVDVLQVATAEFQCVVDQVRNDPTRRRALERIMVAADDFDRTAGARLREARMTVKQMEKRNASAAELDAARARAEQARTPYLALARFERNLIDEAGLSGEAKRAGVNSDSAIAIGRLLREARRSVEADEGKRLTQEIKGPPGDARTRPLQLLTPDDACWRGDPPAWMQDDPAEKSIKAAVCAGRFGPVEGNERRLCEN